MDFPKEVVLHSIENSKTRIYQFADDFIIMCYDHKIEDSVILLQQKVESFQIMCSELNLSFNAQKTQIMRFNRDKRIHMSVNINQILINEVKNIKFLGRIISSNLQ